MSDVTPQVMKSGKQANKNQVVMMAILGVVFLLVLVIFVLKPFGGGSDTPSSAPATPVTTPAAPADASAGAPASDSAPGTAAALPPAPARNRNPFDPPR